jgi:hypothetical protein
MSEDIDIESGGQFPDGQNIKPPPRYIPAYGGEWHNVIDTEFNTIVCGTENRSYTLIIANALNAFAGYTIIAPDEIQSTIAQ